MAENKNLPFCPIIKDKCNLECILYYRTNKGSMCIIQEILENLRFKLMEWE